MFVEPDPGPGEQVVDRMDLVVQSRVFGLYAPTTSRCSYTFSAPRAGALTAEERSAAVDSYFNAILSSGWLPLPAPTHVASLIASGTHTDRRVFPLGYAHNALAAAMFSSLVWSMRLNSRRRVEERRLRARQCPVCRYSLEGLPGSVCPECGARFCVPGHRDAEGPAT